MAWLDWRLTVISLAVMPFFMWLTYRVGRTRREVSEETQIACRRSAHRGDAIGQRHPPGQDVRPAGGGDRALPLANAKLAALQLRGSLVGRWFFMVIGTIFSIMPAFVYWLAGVLDQGRPERADGR